MLRGSVPTTFRRLLVANRTSLNAAGLSGERKPLHLPLGVPPEGTNPAAVRAKWGSNAMDLVQSAAPIKVSGPVAICDGGGGPLGHPIEYIQVKRADADYPAVCKYCGQKFVGDY